MPISMLEYIKIHKNTPEFKNLKIIPGVVAAKL